MFRFLILFCAIVGRTFAQELTVSFYDSLYHDTCSIKLLNAQKTYCICNDRFGRISRLILVKGFTKKNYWKIYFTGEILPMKEGRMRNNLKYGTWKEYYLSGHEMYIGKYRRGRRVGKWVVYYNKEFDLRMDQEMGIKQIELFYNRQGKMKKKLTCQ